MRVNVIGLGKLGFPLAVVAARARISVLGVETNRSRLYRVRRGPVDEPGLSRPPGLEFTGRYDRRLAEADLSIIAVNTPLDHSGGLSLDDLNRALASLVRCLGKRRHVVVVASTVVPGTMDVALKPLVRPGVHLCYSPPFTALGMVAHGLTNPDLILIGEGDKESGDLVERFWREVVDRSVLDDVVFVRTNYVNAEIAKLALSAWLDTKIAFGNMLAGLCNRFKNADVDEVVRILAADSRVNPLYMRAGLGFGGPYFVRDLRALARTAQAVDVFGGGFLNQVAVENFLNTTRIVQAIEEWCGGLHGTRVSLLGVAYKPSVPYTESSQALTLAGQLESRGALVTAYDPMVPYVRDVKCAKSLTECLKRSDLAVVAVPWPGLGDELTKSVNVMRRKRIFDLWNEVRPPRGVEYTAWGRRQKGN